MKKTNKYGVKIGDIFMAKWGYGQTNVDYFQIVDLKGEAMVKIREISYKVVESLSTMSEYVCPDKNRFLTRSMWCADKKAEKAGQDNNNLGIWKKMTNYGDRIFINICPHANAYPIHEDLSRISKLKRKMKPKIAWLKVAEKKALELKSNSEELQCQQS